MSVDLNTAGTNEESHRIDVLCHLTCRPLTDYHRGDIIFDGRCPALYLVVQGLVKVTICPESGYETVVDIFRPDDLFGESVLVSADHVPQRAIALDDVMLMSWSRVEIEEQIERQPHLAITLMQTLVNRGLDYQERLQSFAVDKMPERIIRALLHFADHLGAPTAD